MQYNLLFILSLCLTSTLVLSGILPDRLRSFGILAYSTVTNDGNSIIGTPAANSDIGLYPGTSLTGFPPGVINGVLEITTGKALLAKGDLVIAYQSMANVACNTSLTPAELGGRTFAPGVYCSAAPVTLNGIMYLDTKNQTGPVWIFQFAETLITASSSQVVFIGTPAPCNVFWNIGSSATIGSTSKFKGVINAYTSISFGTGADIVGKALAQNGAVTLLANTMANCPEQAPGSVTCHGFLTSNPNACNNRNGTCVGTDTCVCHDGYNGAQCTGYSCFGLISTNPNVCSGNGTCVNGNTCVCHSGYGGIGCNTCLNIVGGKCTPTSNSGENLKFGAFLALLLAFFQIIV